jgi:hypothetical protein
MLPSRSIAVTPPSIAATQRSIAVTPHSTVATPSSTAATPRSTAATPRSIAATPRSIAVTPRFKRQKTLRDGFTVVADTLNAVFCGLLKASSATPLVQIQTASRHLKTLFHSSLKTVAVTP